MTFPVFEPPEAGFSGEAFAPFAAWIASKDEREALKGFFAMATLKIYLDNCSYNRPFDDQSQVKIHLETEAKLYIQECIRDGVYSLCWSFMLDYENEKNPYEEKRSTIAPWKALADDYCPRGEIILSRGKEIMKQGVGNADALHIACAIEKYCDYFITTDVKLARKNIEGIKVINPINFIIEMEKMR